MSGDEYISGSGERTSVTTRLCVGSFCPDWAPIREDGGLCSYSCKSNESFVENGRCSQTCESGTFYYSGWNGSKICSNYVCPLFEYR